MWGGGAGVGLYEDIVGLSSVGSEEDFVNLVAEKENPEESVYELPAHIYVESIRALCSGSIYIYFLPKPRLGKPIAV